MSHTADCETNFLSPAEIARRQPAKPRPCGADAKTTARAHMMEAGQWSPRQIMGRRLPLGCVSLEITQRCNLDCTACYLSESSEAIKDVPMEELYRRIDRIRHDFGEKTNVQISGGDPTLRDRDELIEIVRYCAEKNLRTSLFTNGILATRELLIDLKAVGLKDVAFHVDLTQERKGFDTEMSMNVIRDEYIERARGTGVGVFFNTTLTDDIAHEVPDLVRYFISRADVVNLASFQMLAATGRGVLGERDEGVTVKSVQQMIRDAAQCDFNFDAMDTGHTDCNSYASGLVIGGKMHDLLDRPDWVAELFDLPYEYDRARWVRSIGNTVKEVVKRPGLAVRSLYRVGEKLVQMGPSALKHREAHRMQFFIHNFMDACHLEEDRIHACSFMVSTPEGPMSMCLHNAKRDDYVLQPVEIKSGSNVVKFWNPLTGKIEEDKPEIDGVEHTRKTARGTAKVRLDAERHAKGELTRAERKRLSAELADMEAADERAEQSATAA